MHGNAEEWVHDWYGPYVPGQRFKELGFCVVLGDMPSTPPLPKPQPALNAHNHSPSIAECPNGDLLAIWYSCIEEPGHELNNLASRLRRGSRHFSTAWQIGQRFYRNASLAISRDHGVTFDSVRTEKCDWEPRKGAPRMAGIHNGLVQMNDGRLFALGRIDPAEVQVKIDFRTPQSISSDMGKTWDVSASEFPAISPAQRPAFIRLQKGPLLWLSFTDQARDRKSRKGMQFGAKTGFGLYAALSFDESKTWPVRKLVTAGGAPNEYPTTDGGKFIMSATEAEWLGDIAVT